MKSRFGGQEKFLNSEYFLIYWFSALARYR
jgi:hypothetical protein